MVQRMSGNGRLRHLTCGRLIGSVSQNMTGQMGEPAE